MNNKQTFKSVGVILIDSYYVKLWLFDIRWQDGWDCPNDKRICWKKLD